MEEMYYPIPEKPQFNEKIRRIQNSDPLSLNKTVNPVIEALIGNIVAIKAYSVPTGSIFWHAAATPPSGHLICDGSEISRTDYANLFNIIGTTFGEGDGETTFALPDLRAKFVRGAGQSDIYSATFGSTQGATSVALSTTIPLTSDVHTKMSMKNYDASISSDTLISVSRSGQIGTTNEGGYVRPYNITLTPIIKY